MRPFLHFLILLALFPSLAAAGTIRVGCGADRYSKAEHYITFCLRNPNAWITEPLVRLGDDFTVQPGLVERWEVQGKNYRLFIRKGIKFHNGKPLDGEAVMKSLKLYAKNRADFLQIVPDSYKIINKYVLEFRSKSKTVHLIGNMAHPCVACYAPDTDPTKEPIGTGPFKFKAYTRDSRLEVVRNENYWGNKPPNEKVVFRFIPDPQTRLLALLNGEVDIIHPVQTQMLLSLPPKGDYNIVTSPLSNYIALTVNIHGEKPFDILRDIRVRKALAYAIDRPLIAKTIFMDKARPAKTLLAPWFWGQGEDFLRGYNYDLRKANQLLESSGWRKGAEGIRVKNGRPLKLRIVSGWPSASVLKPVPELLQQMFGKIGVGIELIQTDDSGVYYGTYMRPGKADLFLEMASNTTGDPTMLLYVLHHSKTPWLEHGYKWAVPGKAYDVHIDRARATTDPKEVVAGIRQAQKILVDEVCAAIPIVFAPDFYLVRKNIQFTPAIHERYTNYGSAVKK